MAEKNNYLIFGKTISLSYRDQELIINMSMDICKQDRSYFIDNYKRDTAIDLYQMNLNGFGAELSFCRLCDIEFDSSTIQEENHFNKADAIMKDGRTVDVKNTTYPSGKLLVRTGKEKKYVDIYVLMIGVFPTFRFSGYIKYKDIIKPELIKNLGKGDSYCLDQSDLNKYLLLDKIVLYK